MSSAPRLSMVTGRSRVSVWRDMVNAERKPITVVWRQRPQWSPGPEPLVRRSGAKPPEVENFLQLHNLKSWIIFPKLGFLCRTKNFVGRLVALGHAPRPVDPSVYLVYLLTYLFFSWLTHLVVQFLPCDCM